MKEKSFFSTDQTMTKKSKDIYAEWLKKNQDGDKISGSKQPTCERRWWITSDPMLKS